MDADMDINPEFRRNLYLEFGTHRLIAIPLVLGLAFAMIYVMAGNELGLGIRVASLGFFLAIAGGWGMRLAGDSVLEEVRARTWDIQKLSAMKPWSMTWGKLFGATLVTWYAGCICIAIFLVATDTFEQSLKIALLSILLSVLMQAGGLISALLGVRRQPDRGFSVSMFGVIAALVLIAVLLKDVLVIELEILWYGIAFKMLDFFVLSAGVFAAWSLIGAYRLMCLTLQVRTTPWLWLVFTVFLALYLNGLALQDTVQAPVATLLNVQFVTALVLSYLIAFWDRKDPLDIRQLLVAGVAGSARRSLQELPPWAVSLAVAAFCAVCLTASDASMSLAPGINMKNLALMAVPLWLLALRDISLLHYFSYSPATRRPELTALIYLALLYWLVPGVLKLVGLEILAHLVLPPLETHPLVSTVIVSIQVLGIGYLLTRRWQQRTRIFDIDTAVQS